MPMYCIIETEDGSTIVEHPPEGTAADVALQLGGTVVDPGPYESYQEACDALEALQIELNDDADDGGSDTPGTQSLEGRYEAQD